MSKKISFIIIALTLILVMVIPSNGVFAANKKVKTVSAVQENGKITVSGEAEDGMLAVAVQVLDEDGNLVKLDTGAVDSENKYKVVIDVPEGKYTIKIADYDGGEILTTKVPNDVVITEINVNLEAPIVGTEVRIEQSDYGEISQKNKPEVTAESGTNYKIVDCFWNYGTAGNLPEGKDLYDMFEGTIEKDTFYYAVIDVLAKDGFAIDSNVKVKVNGEDPAEVFAVYNGNSTHFIAKIKSVETAKEATETTEETIENKETSTPKTGDNIIVFFALFAIAVVGFGILKVSNKRNKKTRHGK